MIRCWQFEGVADEPGASKDIPQPIVVLVEAS